MRKENLVFDLGFHNGDDTDFYLKKGFYVIAVEADPRLVRRGRVRFRPALKQGRLTLINKAMADKSGENVKFYVNQNRPDWSSCRRDLAEVNGSRAKVVSVQATTMGELFTEFGVPRYAKVDVEGNDIMVVEQLAAAEVKPRYVSFETSKQTYADLFSRLYAAGYRKFQLVNQLNNPMREMPKSVKSGEGKRINYRFSKYSSGFFGKDLPAARWLSYDETLSRYLKYKELKVIDNKELALGWLDLHASL